MDICSRCDKEIEKSKNSFTSGYGLNDKNEKVCYNCCAERDKEYMREHGKNTLYLVKTTKQETGLPFYHITNWPGSLSFDITNRRVGRHNIAGVRYDVWFVFEGFYWHGVTYGDNTQLCHCKRTKQVA